MSLGLPEPPARLTIAVLAAALGTAALFPIPAIALVPVIVTVLLPILNLFNGRNTRCGSDCCQNRGFPQARQRQPQAQDPGHPNQEGHIDLMFGPASEQVHCSLLQLSSRPAIRIDKPRAGHFSSGGSNADDGQPKPGLMRQSVGMDKSLAAASIVLAQLAVLGLHFDLARDETHTNVVPRRAPGFLIRVAIGAHQPTAFDETTVMIEVVIHGAFARSPVIPEFDRGQTCPFLQPETCMVSHATGISVPIILN